MKSGFNFICIICAFILGTVQFSCNNSDNYPELYSTMGTVTNLDDYSIDSDVYGKLMPKNPNIINSFNADSIGQRVLININFPNENDKDSKEDSGKEVTIYDLYKVLTKNADDLRLNNEESIDNFGNDDIQITNAYISNKHLNIEFNIGGNNTTIPHRISLLLCGQPRRESQPECCNGQKYFFSLHYITFNTDCRSCNGFLRPCKCPCLCLRPLQLSRYIFRP